MQTQIKIQTCTQCSTEKPLNCFSFRKDRGVYYRQCKECRVSNTRNARENNRGAYNLQCREWRHQTIERQRENRRTWRNANKDKVNESERDRWHLNRYLISLDDDQKQVVIEGSQVCSCCKVNKYLYLYSFRKDKGYHHRQCQDCRREKRVKYLERVGESANFKQSRKSSN